jgi:DHA3 family macrolide efflux protein-like MFS transporter
VRVLRIPGFALLLAGQAVNTTGSWVSAIAIWGFAAFKFDVGAGELATLFVVLSVPGALLGPALGVPIDRFGPKVTLVVANALGVVSALILTQADSYGQIVLLALPLGLVDALARASLDAIPPRIVPDDDLVRANALLGGAQDLAIVVGPVAAAVVNARWGISGAFAVDAATWFVGLLVALRLTVPHETPRRADDTPSWSELRSGARLARRHAGLRWTLGVSASVFALWALFGVLEPLYVRDVLHAGDTTFALLQTVFGVGLVLTSLALAAWGGRLAHPVVIGTAVVASGATAALYLGTRSTVVAFVGVFLWGVDVAFFFVPARTLLQRYAPREFHGRVMSLNHSLEPAAAVVVTPIAALLLTVVSVRALGVAGGVAAAVGGLLMLRAARRLGAPPPAVTPAARPSAGDAVGLGGAPPA